MLWVSWTEKQQSRPNLLSYILLILVMGCRLNIFYEEGGGPSQPEPFVVLALTEMLDAHNHYVRMYRRLEVLAKGCNLAIQFYGDGGVHGSRYSGPTISEVVVLIVEDLTAECDKFDVVAQAVSGESQHISKKILR